MKIRKRKHTVSLTDAQIAMVTGYLQRMEAEIRLVRTEMQHLSGIKGRVEAVEDFVRHKSELLVDIFVAVDKMRGRQ